MPDSRPDTLGHIGVVRGLLDFCLADLEERQREHDQTKLVSPEVELFDEYSDKLRQVSYGSPEYREFLAKLKPALDHHYAAYRHHPEHFRDGIRDMNLLDLLEMLVDWCAATMRHHDGDVLRSIDLNQARFGYSDQLKIILLNTVRYLAQRGAAIPGVNFTCGVDDRPKTPGAPAAAP